MKPVVNNTHDCAPVDYPIGIRFVPHVPIPKPMFTGDELIIACLLSGFAGCMGTVGLAVLWSFL